LEIEFIQLLVSLYHNCLDWGRNYKNFISSNFS